MCGTPEAGSLVLRDDLPAPDAFDVVPQAGSTLLVVPAQDPADERPVGAVVLGGQLPVLRLEHLWVRPDLRRQGLGRSVLAALRRRATDQGASVLSVEVPERDPAMTALAAGARVLGEFLVKRVGPDVRPARVGHRDLTAAEFEDWCEAQVRAYAQDNLPRAGGDVERALERSRADFARFLPDGLATADTSIVVLTSEGEPVGHLWVGHHREPGLSFVFDVEVAEQHRGRGFGRAAMVVADGLAREAGDERIGLHVFGGNVAARRLYRTHGYVVHSTTHDLLASDTG